MLKRSADGRRATRLGGWTWRIAAASTVAVGSILTLAGLPAGASTQSHGRATALVNSAHVALTDTVHLVTTTADTDQISKNGSGIGDQKCKGQDNGQGEGQGQIDDQGQNKQGEGNEDSDCTVSAPTISADGLSPTSGPTAGGTTVTITGTNLGGASAVDFGNGNAATIVSDSSTQIVVTDPAHTPGAVTVTVTTAGGTSNGETFTYVVSAPTISTDGLSPTSGPTAGGTTVTITGTNLGGASAVDFGNGNAATIVSDSSTQIVVTDPAHTPGAVTVTVTTAGGTSNGETFTYVVSGSPTSTSSVTESASSAPTLTGITPGEGSTKGGTTVTLTGTNLCNASAVDFGSDTGTGVSVNTACTIVTVTDPAESAGKVTVTVTAPGGTSNGELFTYVTPRPVIKAAGSPTITGIAPTSGSPAGGETITLVGRNLCDTTGVLFGSNHGTSVSVNASCTTLTVVDPAGTGTVPVTAETAAGNVVAPIEFTYIGSGYWMASSNGSVYSFGGARFYGSLPSIGVTPNSPIVAMADTPDHQGYWLFAADGGVFAFGNAKFYGSVPGVLGPEGRALNQPIVAAEAMPNGEGYRLFAADGGVFDFGDAGFVGSLPCSAPGSPGGLCIVPNKPIESAVSDPLGQGYWLVGGDGGVYALGDTPFLGSLGAQSVSSTIVSMASTPNGAGYWVYGANGSVSPYGNAASYGSMLGRPLAAPVAYGAATTSGHGYWLFGQNGGVFAFGSAPFLGSLQSVGATSSTTIVTGVGF